MNTKPNNESLADLIERGGIYRGVSGGYPYDILEKIIALLPPVLLNTICFKDFDPPLKTEILLQAVLEREALMSTAMGNGIALPHPRTPLIGEDALPFAAIAFPARLLEWNAPDNSKVHTIFLIVSSSAKQHLVVLSKIQFLCQQEKFYSLLKTQAPKADILATIREAEAAWARAL